jgi:hypothetical protein
MPTLDEGWADWFARRHRRLRYGQLRLAAARRASVTVIHRITINGRPSHKHTKTVKNSHEAVIGGV